MSGGGMGGGSTPKIPDIGSNTNLAPPPDATFGGFGKSDFSNVGFGKSDFSNVSFDKSPANALGQDLSGIGVANNQTASMPTGVGGSVPTTPMQQVQAGAVEKGTDWKGYAKDIGKGLTAVKENQMKLTPANTQATGVGMAANQQTAPMGIYGQALAPVGGAAMQAMPQPMQPMQGGIGAQPSFDMMIKALGYGQ